MFEMEGPGDMLNSRRPVSCVRSFIFRLLSNGVLRLQSA